jgi:hypothetical protein
MNLPVDARLERNRNVWDSVVISSLGNNDSTGVDAEVREMGLNVIRASLQAVSSPHFVSQDEQRKTDIDTFGSIVGCQP